MEVTRAQALALRLRAHHLDRRLPPEQWRAAMRPVGLRTTVPDGAVMSLHARAEGATGDELATALAARELVEVRAGHGYLILPPDDVTAFTLGSLPAGEAALRAKLGRLRAALDAGRSAGEAVELAHAAAVDALADGPLGGSELSAAMTRRLPAELSPYCRACATHHVDQTLHGFAALRGAHAKVPGDDGIALADQVLGRPVPRRSGARLAREMRAARDELARRFLRAHAPADARDLAWWLVVPEPDAAATLDRLAGELVPVTYAGRRCWVHADDEAALQAAPSVDGVRLLPPYDPLLTTHDRAAIAPSEAAERLLWRVVANSGVVLADGEVVAAWRGRKGGRRQLEVAVTPFVRWPARRWRPVVAEAAALAPLRGCAEAAVSIGEPVS
ncbi:MAG: DNA glycosylase AlkZ-like family protein [Frankiaceae bacterium]